MKLKRILPIVGVASVVTTPIAALTSCGGGISVSYYNTDKGVLTTKNPITLKDGATYKFSIDMSKYKGTWYPDLTEHHVYIRCFDNFTDWNLLDIDESSVILKKNGTKLKRNENITLADHLLF